MSRWKSALIVFLVLTVAGVAAMTLDYTDTYVADRFHKALSSERYTVGSPFSLDNFLEYYDFDEVCVVVPGREYPELSTQFGLPFKHVKVNDDTWHLLFVKSYYVVAEIHIPRAIMESPTSLEKMRFKRWEAIVEIVDDGQGKRMEFIGK